MARRQLTKAARPSPAPPMFAFGRNWSSYASQVGETAIAEAVRGLCRLLGTECLSGKRFLDVGCGSGIHSLAAIRLGARDVVAIDVDPDSVSAAQYLLGLHAPPSATWCVVQADFFDLSSHWVGQFDIVYAWGVLHHTGKLRAAIRHVAGLVRPGGLLLMALYRKTWLCWLWKIEKAWYARSSPRVQRIFRQLYLGFFAVCLLVTGRRLKMYAEAYVRHRGMDFYHDIHDWLGGYPYESTTPSEVGRLMRDLGFTEVRTFVRHGRLFGRGPGVLGSGCDEYVYRAPQQPSVRHAG